MATPNEPSPSPTITGPEVVIPTAERMRIASPIGWASIFGASAVALGLWLLLHLFGIGVGLTSLDPGEQNSLRGLGVGVGIWNLIVPILALFVGGLIAGRLAPTINRFNAAIHGAVTWAVATVATFVVMAWMFAALVGGAAAAGGRVVSAVPDTLQHARGAMSSMSMEDVGLEASDLVAPVNRWLESEDLPPVNLDELEAAARDALRTAVHDGKLDRDRLIVIITRHTQLTPADAERVADQVSNQYDAARARAGELADQARVKAIAAADATGKLLLWITLSMLLSLCAAIGGAMITVTRERHAHVRPTSKPVAPPPPSVIVSE